MREQKTTKVGCYTPEQGAHPARSCVGGIRGGTATPCATCATCATYARRNARHMRDD
jgi:hypothetical protein